MDDRGTVPGSSQGELVTRARQLIERLVTVGLDDDGYAAASAAVGRALAAFDGSGGTRVPLGMASYPGAYALHTGALHPHAPPIQLVVTQVEPLPVVVGTVTFGFAYEGPPACVHGGVIASAFDEVFGLALAASGGKRMTAQLKIAYRAPSPLKTELRFDASVASIVGRKTVVTGTLHAGDVLCAEAEGLFVAPRDGTLDDLAVLRERLQ